MTGKPDTPSRPDSPYSRLAYRRLIAWPQRIEREWPFLEREIAKAPEASVLDLGCGTGEHSRYLASTGVRAVGIDRSEEQITQAHDYESEFPPHGPDYLLGDFTQLGELTTERFGLALCLGNVLPHLEDDALIEALRQTAARLQPSGRLLIQVLNYERIFAQGLRHLPVNLRANPDDPKREIVFLRLMKPDDAHHVLFYPTTLELTPGGDPPLELKASKEVRLRAWQRAELERAVEACGFQVDAVFGDMTGGAFDATESSDVVMTAKLR